MRETIRKYQPYFPAAFFILGFAFDLLTTDRIDQSFSLWMQFGYLFVAGLFIFWEVTRPRLWIEGPKFFQWIWKYHLGIIHFCFGSLLSVYTIFYFKSASFWTSIIFLFSMVSLLLLNEVPRFQAMGRTLRFTMFAICLSSYLTYLIPVFSGAIGTIPFSLSIIISSAITFFIIVRAERKTPADEDLISKGLIPAVLVNLVFCVLYLFKILPPVPLSLKDIGIYHKIEKSEGQYNLFYEKADWWRFWEKGAQTFLAAPGDAVNCYVQIFSPTNFQEKMELQWHRWEKDDWKQWDSIALPISGGRSEGYRGHAYKKNYDPGEWQVRVVTSDGRELGRIPFKIIPREESEEPRILLKVQR